MPLTRYFLKVWPQVCHSGVDQVKDYQSDQVCVACEDRHRCGGGREGREGQTQGHRWKSIN